MINLDNVTKTFSSGTAKNNALDNLTLEIPKGSAYGLLGSNGSGKSTILRLLSGVYRQNSGLVTIEGEKVYDNVALKSRVIFINDETTQWQNYTLDEMRDYFKLFYDKFSDEKFDELWNCVKLPRNRKLSTFSKGMKRQSAVICGIASRPDYLFLDEAFDGLDPMMRIMVKQILVDAMLDSGLTTILSSHNLKEIDEFCDRAGLLHKGKLLFNQNLEDVKGNVNKIQTAFSDLGIKNKDEWNTKFSELNALHFERMGSVIYAIVKKDREKITSELKKSSPLIMDIIPLSLEEIFIYEMEGQGYELSGIDGIKK